MKMAKNIGKEIKPLWHKNVTMMQHKNGSNVAHKYREYDKCKNTNGAERHSDGGQTARFTTAQAAIIKVINSWWTHDSVKSCSETIEARREGGLLKSSSRGDSSRSVCYPVGRYRKWWGASIKVELQRFDSDRSKLQTGVFKSGTKSWRRLQAVREGTDSLHPVTQSEETAYRHFTVESRRGLTLGWQAQTGSLWWKCRLGGSTSLPSDASCDDHWENTKKQNGDPEATHDATFINIDVIFQKCLLN